MKITVYNIISGLAEYIISHVWSVKETFEIAESIKNLIAENDIIIQFVRMCINAGTGKTKCYDDAHDTPHPHPTPHRKHVSIRKKVQLALYEYLKPLEEEEEEIPEEEMPPQPLIIFCYRDMVAGDYQNYYGVNLYFIEYEKMPFFEEVQDHFADQIEHYMGLTYSKSLLSTCEADEMSVSDPAEFDFVFEVKQLKREHFQYWGHWHNGTWKPATHVFPQFDRMTLTTILNGRKGLVV